MKKKTKEPFPFGEFLRELREKKGVSLKRVEEETGVSNAYLSQLETGDRRRLPGPDRLRALADYYNVSVAELLEKAGYYDPGEVKETYEQKIEREFQVVIHDPRFRYGARLKDKYTLDEKRFIVEMYLELSSQRSQLYSFFPPQDEEERNLEESNWGKLLENRQAPLTLGEAIKTGRENQNMSPKELAKAMDITQAALLRIEEGQDKNPSLDVTQKLAKALTLPFLCLFKLRQSLDMADFVRLNQNAEHLVAIYTSLPLEKANQLLDYANYLYVQQKISSEEDEARQAKKIA